MQVSRAVPVPSRNVRTSVSASLLTPVLLVLGAVALAVGRPITVSERFLAGALVVLAIVALGAAVIIVRKAQATEIALSHANQLVTERDHRQRLLLEAADSSLTVIDRDGLIASQNSGITSLLGKYPFEVTGKPLASLFGEANQTRLIGWMANAALHGTCVVPRLRLDDIGFPDRWVALTFVNLLDEPTVNGIVMTSRDISELVRAEGQISDMRGRDELTGLPNRASILRELGSGQPANLVAVIDLASFGEINRQQGEGTGNAILQVIAHRLRQETRQDDLVGRLDGDRFVVALRGESAGAHLPTLLDAVFGRPIALGTGDLLVAADCGACLIADDGAAVALNNAERALETAQAGVAPSPVMWSPVAVEQAAWSPAASDIRVGLQNDEFVLHYQPIVTVETGETREVEALLRWNHPDHGLIGPADILPLAESCDLIQPLTWWTIEEACRQGALWLAERPASPMTISVNLSARMLGEDDLAERISLALCRHGLPARFLRLEIVESTLVADLGAATQALRRLKAIGIQLALDDFGTGFCSLAYLQHFPIDVIKIDRSFVQSMSESVQSCEIVRSIIELARRLHVQTTAEGVETWEQFEHLRRLGSDRAQGFLLARPLSPDRIVLASLDRLVDSAA